MPSEPTPRPAASAPEQVRPTRAEIDLDALAANLGVVRSAAAASQILAVVKADAYGHGLLPVARRLVKEGIDGLGVALVEEGLALREQGIRAPIVVLNGIYAGAHREVLRASLTPVVYDLGDIERFHAVAAADDAVAEVHLKVDTGMSRLGVPLEELDGFLDGLVRWPRVRLGGLMTHFSSAEDDPEAMAEQLERFTLARQRLRSRGHDPACVHAANSAALMLRERARFDMVRAGVILYGVRPGPDVDAELRPVMRVVTSVARVETVRAGGYVGYHRTWRASRDSRIATLAIGYGDGWMRHLSNRGQALVRGRRCPIVGLVSMDLTGVDVTDVPGCERGDEAVVLGAQGGELLRAEEVAAAAGTIAYEVLTNVSPRVPRIYRGER